jgi:aryl-alcohol dehydrogenase-like predicted oxidoreductase
MDFRRLGTTGVQVSPLCLGGMTFGDPDEKSFMHGVASDEKTAHAVLDRAFERGINFVDTADVYGQDGLAERILGKWIAASGKRDRMVLATKLRFRMGDGPNGTGASRYRIARACDASLRRLQTDRIDLYQLHMQDIACPEEETLRALDDLVRAGKVVYIGCCNYAAYRMIDAAWIAKTAGLARFATLQASYSLVVRDLEREHVPACLAHGMGILPYAPLAAGFLTGKVRRGQKPPPGTRLDKFRDRWGLYDNDRCWRILDVVDAVAREVESTPARVSLAWVIRKPAVSSAIFGARTVEQLDDNLGALDLTLSPDQMKRLDEASRIDLGYPYDFISRIQARW